MPNPSYSFEIGSPKSHLNFGRKGKRWKYKGSLLSATAAVVGRGIHVTSANSGQRWAAIFIPAM